MPKWRLKNILLCGVSFSIALILMFGIGFLNIADNLKFGLIVAVMVLTVASIIFINEKRLKKEEEK